MPRTRRSTGPKKTITRSGRKYQHKGCSTKKSEAKKRAESARKKGKVATVVKNGSKYCWYVGGNRKKAKVGSTRRRKRRA